MSHRSRSWKRAKSTVDDDYDYDYTGGYNITTVTVHNKAGLWKDVLSLHYLRVIAYHDGFLLMTNSDRIG